ncbi:hypothetical protein U5903_07335 [Cereibacter johrii]|uniref:hypothetical protein n=1 Tax=Cereibacter johrii TaxID=445629 RepID=UPI002B25FAC8|nr:hypothetical protein [Cereibacter johrii]MEA5160585.1 hypothetical protein [Cereibacter johrii]
MQDEAIPSRLPLKMPGIFENPVPGADGLEHLRRTRARHGAPGAWRAVRGPAGHGCGGDGIRRLLDWNPRDLSVAETEAIYRLAY